MEEKGCKVNIFIFPAKEASLLTFEVKHIKRQSMEKEYGSEDL